MAAGAHRDRELQVHVLADLRERVERLECRGQVRKLAALPFGVGAIDGHLPGGGLGLGSLHEVAQGGAGAEHSEAATLFAAGILARLGGPVLWCVGRRDLFGPGLAGAGLHPDRVLYAETGREAQILPAMEESLRSGRLSGVVCEVGRFGLTPSRRLQLAAEVSGTIAIVLRRAGAHAHREEANAAATRWQVAMLPSGALAAPGLGRARWRVDLVRCRGAGAHSWTMEACDAQGRLALAPDLADRPAEARPDQRAAAG